MNESNISWRGLKQIYPQFILLIKVLFIIVLVDLAASIFLPTVLDESFYLKKYLSEDYEKIADDFYHNNYFIQPHKDAGWVNTPNLRRQGDLWHTDSLGARISPTQSEADAQHKALINNENLIFVLGSSVLNGFTLDYKDTVNNYLNNFGYQVFNFASALYTVDQSFALYESTLSSYKPKVLVVGIHDDADSITNMFAAFRDIGDKHSPFLKPAYQLSDNQLIKKLPPTKHQQLGDLSLMLADLKKNDAHYYKFEYFQRLGLLPFSDMLRQAILRIGRKFYDVDQYIKDVELQKSVMSSIVETAKQDDTDVIFVKLEGQYDQEKSLFNRLLHQFVQQDRNALHNQLLKETAFNILYTSELFKETGEPVSTFYLEDQLHLSAGGSELLAEKINQRINNLKLQ